ncbi:hypothetical protein EVAR_41714_1 [Eumeta japonica]|uniref:Uncharacterized protein n=1 Tax=Eumeta variegata TaxID=151549 RepID=A0A4C1XHX2_EUMVA|nr:hypothetical protein EVAR_41714_1 [Eumeta japonica]
MVTDLTTKKRWCCVTRPRGKQACEPPKNRRSPMLMDIHNPREVTNALLTSWEGIGYLMVEALADGGEGG